MNEKLRKLSEQCLTHGKDFGFDLEKFAELLVKECADIAKEKQVFVGYDVSTAIKQHFGID